MMRIAYRLLVVLVAAGPANADTIAVVNARIATMGPAGTVEGGTILIRNEKIAAAGKNITVPEDALIVDARQRLVTPGLVLPASGLSLVEVRNGVPGVDDRVCAAPCRGATFDVSYAVNPDSTLIPAARRGGITRAIVIPEPGEDLFSGRAAAIHLGDAADVLVRSSTAAVLYLGKRGAARAGGSRAAAIVAVRAALDEARALARRTAADLEQHGAGKPDIKALLPVVNGVLPLLVAVHRAPDIRQVLALGRDYELRLILLGAEEGWRVAGEIAEAGIPVILNPLHNGPDAFETMGTSLDNARLLHEAGVTIAIRGNGPHRAREARFNAGNAVANGLPWHAALQAITVNPARLFGLDDRFGTIEAGREADLVIWDGDPLEHLTSPVAVFIRGEVQSLSSRGTMLRDRYLKLGERYPPAYR